MRDRFALVVERWDLEEDEVTFLLGLDRIGVQPCSARLPVVAETSMRLLVELDGLLSQRMSQSEIALWARAEAGDGPDPVTFMSLGVHHLRALVVAARRRDASGV